MKSTDPMMRVTEDRGEGLFAFANRARTDGGVTGPRRPPFEQRSIDRRGSAIASIEASRKLDRGRDYVLIMRWLQSCGARGGTHKEWCAKFGRASNTSGRFTELFDAGYIERDRVNRRGASSIWTLSGAGEIWLKEHRAE